MRCVVLGVELMRAAPCRAIVRRPSSIIWPHGRMAAWSHGRAVDGSGLSVVSYRIVSCCVGRARGALHTRINRPTDRRPTGHPTNQQLRSSGPRSRGASTEPPSAPLQCYQYQYSRRGRTRLRVTTPPGRRWRGWWSFVVPAAVSHLRVLPAGCEEKEGPWPLQFVPRSWGGRGSWSWRRYASTGTTEDTRISRTRSESRPRPERAEQVGSGPGGVDRSVPGRSTTDLRFAVDARGIKACFDALPSVRLPRRRLYAALQSLRQRRRTLGSASANAPHSIACE